MSAQELIRIEDLCKSFSKEKTLLGKPHRSVKALEHISLSIQKGETLGVVGESGCGKSTLGRCLLRLIEPTSGQVYYREQPLAQLSREELRLMRQKLQIIFQDPYSSLNPRMTVCELIRAPLDAFNIGSRAERMEQVKRMIERVGLSEQYLYRYAHEFSGGQRQRIVIARALILTPEFVVCDEPVSALDVSVRAQVLNLMKGLQREFGLTYLFISHDLSVVKYVSDRIAVMYLGHLVELMRSEQSSLHPYTQALLSAIPVPDVERRHTRVLLQGDIPSPYEPPSGCCFHTRCPRAQARCAQSTPPFTEVAPGHFVACHLYAEGAKEE